MESSFLTLQEFMFHTKSVTYLLMVATLIGMGLFWKFLAGGDEE